MGRTLLFFKRKKKVHPESTLETNKPGTYLYSFIATILEFPLQTSKNNDFKSSKNNCKSSFELKRRGRDMTPEATAGHNYKLFSLGGKDEYWNERIDKFEIKSHLITVQRSSDEIRSS
jgi:hypothetical protein